MIEDVIAQSRRRIAELEPESVDEVRQAGRPIVGFSPAMAQADRAIKDFLYPRLYRHARIMRIMGEAEEVVRRLFGHYVERAGRSAAGMAERARCRRRLRPRAADRRFHRRHDRPLRHGRARAAVRRDAGAALGAQRSDRRSWSRPRKFDLLSPRRMNVFQLFTEHVRAAVETLVEAGVLPAALDLSRIVVEPPREASHGDLATNAAMALAKDAGLKPRDLAEKIAAELRKLPEVTKAEIAGPGFINLTLDPAVWRAALADAIRAGAGLRPRATSARASRSTSNMSRPIRPARCMSAIAAARCSATRSPICWRSRALR